MNIEELRKRIVRISKRVARRTESIYKDNPPDTGPHMTRDELKKEINRKIRPICKAAGFTRKNRQLIYYKLSDCVLKFIIFDFKRYGYDCGIYILPLYLPDMADGFLTLEYGDTLQHIAGVRSIFYRLSIYNGTEFLMENIDNVAEYIENTAFKWFETVGNPKWLSDNILSYENEIIIFNATVYSRYKIKAYSDLYLKNYSSAVTYFKKYLSFLKNDGDDETVQERNSIIRLIKMIKLKPQLADEVLLKNIAGAKEKFVFGETDG